ncbi:exosome complex exonuclease RRP40, partial [Protomyces lactucae-debilis]
MSVVLPGAALEATQSKSAPRKLGPGLRALPDGPVIVVKAGKLHTTNNGVPFVASSQKRYVPASQDSVIAQVTARFAEGYRVDLGGALTGSLGALAFFNVNRKNKPNLVVGSLVYARVVTGGSVMEPEIECMNAEGKAGGFGELKGGYLMKGLSTGLCRRLLAPNNVVLEMLGAQLSFELAVGLNGRVWVNAEDTKTILLVRDCILQTETMVEHETRSHIRALL